MILMSAISDSRLYRANLCDLPQTTFCMLVDKQETAVIAASPCDIKRVPGVSVRPLGILGLR